MGRVINNFIVIFLTTFVKKLKLDQSKKLKIGAKLQLFKKIRSHLIILGNFRGKFKKSEKYGDQLAKLKKNMKEEI